jgi:hypothetical protein
MQSFVREDSIVKEIWGSSDTILFIFAGASAEFALNKAVDWLYFTGRLPSDPLGRLFSTVAYARQIVFSSMDDANRSIDKIAAIHKGVESARGSTIPDWAYRDVLFMLIDYSIRSYEVLERKLSHAEKEEVFNVFYRVGDRMKLKGLPNSYDDWVIMRNEHLQENLINSHFTKDLFLQYKKHLGSLRFKLLIESQILICPLRVKQLLNFRKSSLVPPVLYLYKVLKSLRVDWFLKKLVFPKQYFSSIKELDVHSR